MRALLLVLLVALVARGAAAETRTDACPATPASLTNGQTLADGWQAWIEGADDAQVEAWSNGLAFLLPMVIGSPAATELQCVTRVPGGSGQLITIEARKALDGRYRCSFANGAFTCAR